MTKIISLIIKNLNRINKIIWKIIIFLSKFIKIDEVKHLENKPDDIKYRLFNVDEPAIIEPFVKIEHKDHKQLNDNTGKQNQFECKVCSYIFSTNPNKNKDIVLKCHHCNHILSKKITREKFDIYVCRNNNCPFIYC